MKKVILYGQHKKSGREYRMDFLVASEKPIETIFDEHDFSEMVIFEREIEDFQSDSVCIGVWPCNPKDRKE